MRIRLAFTLILVFCLGAASALAQSPPQVVVAGLEPPCDSQNRVHRDDAAVVVDTYARALELIQDLSSLEFDDFLAEIDPLLVITAQPPCPEISILAPTAALRLVAAIYDRAGIALAIDMNADLAPLLDDWLAWAAAFALDEGSVRFWLGSFENYQGRGLEVGCMSYLLPVDTGLARGRNTLAELSLALSALFDPDLGHPDASVETEDWIKELGLSVAGIHIDEGFAEISLGGQLVGIGTCGDAILEAQILQTVFQFADITRARITDGERNLVQVVDMSDRFSQEELRQHIYERDDLYWLRD